MSTVNGPRARTPDEYRQLVAQFLKEAPHLIELWKRNAQREDATEHCKTLFKYGTEYLEGHSS
jgi:hypothetical protein